MDWCFLGFRLFWEKPMIISGRVWSAILATALTTTFTFSTVHGADPKLLPKDTEIIFSVNLKQILDSELVKTYQKTMEQGKKELETQIGDNPILKYLKNAGFDVYRDLHSITVAGNGDRNPVFSSSKGRSIRKNWPPPSMTSPRTIRKRLRLPKMAIDAFMKYQHRAKKRLSPP